jgi:Na+-translocating ferredoxin:NAD+ oxidoreductase RnfD subunit
MSPDRSALRRYGRTPKGQFGLLLLLLTAVAGMHAGWAQVAPGLLGATVAATLVDALWLRWRSGAWTLPDGALLTGWLVALIVSPHEPWPVAAVTSVVGVASKQLMRVGRANLFNPAAFALVGTFYVFDTGQSWWGALPDLPLPWLLALASAGVYITLRLNKAPVVLAFLGGYVALATANAFLGNPGTVAELYRAPDLHAALFFAFFMVTDPPTSPPKHPDQLVYGAITAVAAFAVYRVVGAAYFLLAGLLVANVWEGWRKRQFRLVSSRGVNRAEA